MLYIENIGHWFFLSIRNETYCFCLDLVELPSMISIDRKTDDSLRMSCVDMTTR